MSLKQKLQLRLKTIQRFGVFAVIREFADRVGKAACGLKVVELITLDPQSDEIKSDPAFEFRFLSADEVESFCDDPVNDLSLQMADRIRHGQDHCFAALQDNRLAAYGWYATGCIEGEHNHDTPMSYPPTMAYMYKGFTHPEFRGHRLHGIGMALALQNLAPMGVTSLVSTVDWANHASLKSCDRLGYKRLGRMIVIGKTSPQVLRSPKISQSLGVRLGANAERRPTWVAEAKEDRESDLLLEV